MAWEVTMLDVKHPPLLPKIIYRLAKDSILIYVLPATARIERV
jgi:hypothetical protein